MEDFKGLELRGRESFWTFENRIPAQGPHIRKALSTQIIITRQNHFLRLIKQKKLSSAICSTSALYFPVLYKSFNTPWTRLIGF